MKKVKGTGNYYEALSLRYPFTCSEEGDLARECEAFKLHKKGKKLLRKSKDDSLVGFSDTD